MRLEEPALSVSSRWTLAETRLQREVPRQPRINAILVFQMLGRYSDRLVFTAETAVSLPLLKSNS
ncbi:hypothetical protein LCGC14_1692350 [marine sediment metagenome]|uniref:Uncharacterized protein n=1 Tax=marine sediment metagenome TaxID=412755 RepID=A0A0F9HKV3_9ZZZZ